MLRKAAVHRMVQCLALTGIISIASMQCVYAQGVPPGCSMVCGASCVKPWAFADRWDDFSVPGSTGWAGNGTYDAEKYTDTNNNLYYDNGEPFVDGSSANTRTKGAAGPMDGQYSAEYYDPLNTGYVAWKDLGLELTLKIGQPSGVTIASLFEAIDLPIPGSSLTGASRYQWNIANCNPMTYGPGDTLTTETGDMGGPTAQGMRDLINQDPGAYWDDGCQCVKSEFEASPRVLILPLYDPRVPLVAGKMDVVVTKLVGFFLESSDANANAKGRLIAVEAPGASGGAIGSALTTCAGAGGFVYDCPVAARPTTWGKLKGMYR